MKTRKLPQTDSIQELARFWDTHDLTEFEDKLEEVTEPVFGRRTVVRLDVESAKAKPGARLEPRRGGGE